MTGSDTIDAPEAFAARLALLRVLERRRYRFAPPSPTSHRRILLRRGRAQARTLEEMFGWNMRFAPGALDVEILDLMRTGDMLAGDGMRLVSTLRVGSVDGLLLLHSGFHRRRDDSVFLGPDSQRFAAFVAARRPALTAGDRVLDIGCGTGVGGLVALSRAPRARLVLADINPLALQLAAINAAFAGTPAEFRLADGAPDDGEPFALILANPPFVAGGREPLYSRGGGRLGQGLALDWAAQAVGRLAPGGRLLLYSGSAIAGGEDRLKRGLEDLASATGCDLAYEELDVDILPELLLKPAYWGAERIAAVGAVLTRPG